MRSRCPKRDMIALNRTQWRENNKQMVLYASHLGLFVLGPVRQLNAKILIDV